MPKSKKKRGKRERTRTPESDIVQQTGDLRKNGVCSHFLAGLSIVRPFNAVHVTESIRLCNTLSPTLLLVGKRTVMGTMCALQILPFDGL